MADHAPGTEELAQLTLDRERREARIVVRVAAVDLKVVHPVEKLLEEVDGADVQRLELDLAGVSFADSSVVRIALKAHDSLAPKGAKIVIKAAADVRRVFDLTQTADLFEIVPVD